MHEFELADGTRIRIPDDEFDDQCLDDTPHIVADCFQQGDTFTYVFDVGDYWASATMRPLRA